jgi:hypothetical protein
LSWAPIHSGSYGQIDRVCATSNVSDCDPRIDLRSWNPMAGAEFGLRHLSMEKVLIRTPGNRCSHSLHDAPHRFGRCLPVVLRRAARCNCVDRVNRGPSRRSRTPTVAGLSVAAPRHIPRSRGVRRDPRHLQLAKLPAELDRKEIWPDAPGTQVLTGLTRVGLERAVMPWSSSHQCGLGRWRDLRGRPSR